MVSTLTIYFSLLSLIAAASDPRKYVYVYEGEEFVWFSKQDSSFVCHVPATVSTALSIEPGALALGIQAVLNANGIQPAVVIPAEAPAAPAPSPTPGNGTNTTDHTGHSSHTGHSPHAPPQTAHMHSNHANMEHMSRHETCHEIPMNPPTPHADQGPPAGHPPTVHQSSSHPPDGNEHSPVVPPSPPPSPSAHPTHPSPPPSPSHPNPPTPAPGMGMAMGKSVMNKDTTEFVSITVAGSASGVSVLNSTQARAALAAELGVDVSAVDLGEPTCVDCAAVPDVSNLCPPTRRFGICELIARTILCLSQGFAVEPDTTPDTDPACPFNLNTLQGLNDYFTTICSPASV